MDTYLTIASKRDRDTDDSDPRPIPEDVVRRILDAGRLSGSAQNRQPWRFLVVEDADRRGRLAQAVYEPGNLHGATLVIAIAGVRPFDLGRCAQSMMLAAWNEGIGSTPNGVENKEAAAEALGLEEAPAIVLSFGYPANPRDPQSRAAEEWSAKADRKPLDELVERI